VLEGHKDKIEAKKLKAFLGISNMQVGDAIANLLLIEAVLQDRDMNVRMFADLYADNPARTYKAVVKDRTKFKVVWDESRLTHPVALQETIDKLVGEVEEGKAFVRPSGTEDILRVYAEARTQE